jgi:hypothetical protein
VRKTLGEKERDLPVHKITLIMSVVRGLPESSSI